MKRVGIPACILDAINHYEIESYDCDKHMPGYVPPAGKVELIEAVRQALGKRRATVCLSADALKYFLVAMENIIDIQENGGNNWERYRGKRNRFAEMVSNIRWYLK